MVLIMYKSWNEDKAFVVSVPLRGLWFLSREETLVKCTKQIKVSVPLRGLWFLSTRQPLSLPTLEGSFRPLAGIMVLIGIPKNFTLKCYNNVSVPLRGLWFLSMKFTVYGADSQYVSVPLRGLWFLSAPFINGFMKPSKWHFAGRIIYFHHFFVFCKKMIFKKLLRTEF